MKDTNIQWHPGFIGAMNLELMKDRDGLTFIKEHNLNTRPLQIDLLVVRKNGNARIENEIGRIFRGHNILEYKSPQEELNIDTFYKAAAYACLYKSYGKTLDFIKADDVTVSLVRKARPYGLFRYFREHRYQVACPYRGIYYIEGKVLFPTQIVVTKELDRAGHIWLGSLSDQLEKQELLDLVKETGRMEGKEEREFAESVLEVGVRANRNVLAELIGDERMSEELIEIMMPVIEPQLVLREQKWMEKGIEKGIEQGIEKGIEQGIEKGIEQGIEKGIGVTIELLRELKKDDREMKEILIEKYELSEEKAEFYLRQFAEK